MSSYSSLLFRDAARAKLLAGARLLADAVRPTLAEATMTEVTGEEPVAPAPEMPTM